MKLYFLRCRVQSCLLFGSLLFAVVAITVQTEAVSWRDQPRNSSPSSTRQTLMIAIAFSVHLSTQHSYIVRIISGLWMMSITSKSRWFLFRSCIWDPEIEYLQFPTILRTQLCHHPQNRRQFKSQELSPLLFWRGGDDGSKEREKPTNERRTALLVEEEGFLQFVRGGGLLMEQRQP